MPYTKFTKKKDEKKKWCIKNKNTKKVTCFDSEKKRKNGIMMRHAIDKGFKPTGKKGTGRISSSGTYKGK